MCALLVHQSMDKIQLTHLKLILLRYKQIFIYFIEAYVLYMIYVVSSSMKHTILYVVSKLHTSISIDMKRTRNEYNWHRETW